MDKLTAMATFVKVVDAGSFTRAADALACRKLAFRSASAILKSI